MQTFYWEDWGRLKLTASYFICIIRAVSSPGSQYAKSILEPDIQGMKLLCGVMERTVNQRVCWPGGVRFEGQLKTCWNDDFNQDLTDSR